MFSFCRMNSPYIYCRFQTVFLHQIIILNFKSQLKIYTKRKIASKKQNVEHKCILQESCKTVRRWQRYILLVKGGHCVGDCKKTFVHLAFVYVVLIVVYFIIWGSYMLVPETVFSNAKCRL